MKRLAMIAILLASAGAAQSEDKRQLGAHEHGHGALNIAVEGRRVSMELRIPGADIVGFEHKPESKEQKAVIAEAEKILRKPLALFVPDAAAQCKLTSAEVEFETEGEHEEEHGHKKSHGHDKHGHKEKHSKEEKHEGEHHAEFHANYVLECSQIAKLTTLTFAFFKSFPRSEEIEVQILGPKGQAKHEATPKSPVIKLGGLR